MAVEPVRWFERSRWVETSARRTKGLGARIDIEGGAGAVRARRPRGELVTVDLLRDQDGGGWTLCPYSNAA